MVGINDQTGKWLGGFSHVVQSLGIIFTTPIAARVMRRTFGSAVPALLGRSLTIPTILKFKTAIIVAVELFEPRFRITIIPGSPRDTPARLRKGQVGFVVQGHYRPRGHLGDPTEEDTESIFAIGTNDGQTIRVS